MLLEKHPLTGLAIDHRELCTLCPDVPDAPPEEHFAPEARAPTGP